MNASLEYQLVNEMLRMMHQPEIPAPEAGTDLEKLEHLITVYTGFRS